MGAGKEPMFGDYEAQRHWQEITFNLPIADWYRNTSDNDLQYWGLDYPPLSAYHSWLVAYFAASANGSWVELHTSRGLESYEHKQFMRQSVICADLLSLIPATVLYVWKIQASQKASYSVKCTLLGVHFLYPGHLLIDFAHFQYNCVSLGAFVMCIYLLSVNQDVFACVLFVCALGYKQMELYHALPVFCYILGLCLAQRTVAKKLKKLSAVGGATVASFVLIFCPFLFEWDTLSHVLARLFPVGRGLFEDKVANVWCALSVLVKVKQMFPPSTLAAASAVLCLLLCLPSCVMLLTKPDKRQLRYALCNVSLVFFLCSFQVHEKSILLVAVPVLLLVTDHSLASTWLLMISVLSLYPLCVKDETKLAFYAVSVFYYVFVTDCFNLSRLGNKLKSSAYEYELKLIGMHTSVIGGIGLCLVHLLVPAPSTYPDLFPMLNALYCCAHFLAFMVYFYSAQLTDYKIPTQKLKKK